MALFWTPNGAMNTVAAPAGQSTGTTIKTHQQVQPATTRGLAVVAFGVEFATVLTAAAYVELIDTAAVAATVTAAVAAGVQPYDDVSSAAGVSSVALSASATGYNASAEGTITATRMGKHKILPAGASSWEWEWSLGREFYVPAGRNLRLRITTATSVTAYTWILWNE